MEKETIIASFKYQIFFAANNGFTVSTFKKKHGKNIKCIGNNLPQYKNIDYELTGIWETGKTGEEQFKVESFSEHVEKEKDSIIAFLSSGAIKGIGKKTAERIFDMYGLDTLEIIEKTPENLLRVCGITAAKLDQIVNSYSQNHMPQDLVSILMPNGFSTQNILKIYRLYKSSYKEKIEDNPYSMCDIGGITFTMCDRVARKLGFGERDGRRTQCAIKEALKELFFSGKVGATKEEIVKRTAYITGNDFYELYGKELLYMTKIGLLSYKKVMIEDKAVTYFYKTEVKNAEEKLATEIKRSLGINDKSIEAEDILSRDKSIVFDNTQKEAIINAFRYKLSIITGGPGTGKTTITKKIAQINKALCKEYPIFLAPTGKAARRISESTGLEAYTIHSYLNLRPVGEEDVSYDDDKDIVIEDKCVIIDEFSMVDMMLAKLLFEHMKNCRIIIVGDPDQLQSVGAGNVLHDMIDSHVIPTTKLIYEHRQSDGSTIKENANGMQKGIEDFKCAKDFISEYIRKDNLEDTMQSIEDRMVEEYLRYTKSFDYNSVICLCPYKNYAAGVYSLNTRLQDIINPTYKGCVEFKGVHDMVFRVGDPVMHVEKNTDEVSNGNTGIVRSIKKIDNELTLTAEFDLGKEVAMVDYTAQNISQLILAYAMTVHKSQGSEYDAVVTCLSKAHRMMLKRRIPYTAITRAKKSVSIIMDENETLKKAITNDSLEGRNTLLAYYLKQGKETVRKEVVPAKNKNKEIEGQMQLFF